ncbi:MAG: alpha/beta hydrolase [Chloroflexota bacterium]|nr:alpha/beta hydrolase [Chloroflexota bacterium]
MPTARVNDCNLYYEIHEPREADARERARSLPPLLFINGLGGHLGEIPHLIEAYGRRVRMAVFDSRGCGRSEKPDGDYSIPGFADDAAALLDALGIASAVVYGSSMGGMIAQELVLRHPEKVRALILGCTTAGAIRGAQPSPETIQRMVRNQSLSGDEALVAGWQLGYSRSYIDAHYDVMIASSREASRYGAPRESYMRQVLAAARHDTYDRLQQIACPVMIIHGTDDVMIPAGNAELLKQGIPHAELRLLAGMGHGYNLEAQPQADELVMDFHTRHAGAAESAAHAVR